MAVSLTAERFTKLLLTLDANRERAGEKYEELRRTLVRFFEWRGAPFPEEHADEVFNRSARRLDDGVEIKNIGGYCYEVARLVFLESVKSQDTRRVPLESVRVDVAAPDLIDEALEKEMRLSCLDDCLGALPKESSDLILEYYSYDKRAQINRRKALADRFGLRRDALANRAQRVRDKLEQCVSGCLRKRSI